MAWYEEAVFYHIYPLGLTDAPKQNAYAGPVHRLDRLFPWIEHIQALGCNALYIGPLFESVSHGYDTTDYYKVDSRLGTNDDLKRFVAQCHDRGIRVILDGVFNHVGRDFFAFRDLKANREGSAYTSWFRGLDFQNNDRFNDGFRYENWGGDDALVKLDQRQEAVQTYFCDVISFWVREFDIDGLRLDAADVLDFGFMQTLRHLANTVKPDFWLMGEVIHGHYPMWVNDRTLHSVTDYQLHKALFSGHNDHNYFEIAHTVRRIYDMGLKLYDFVDNHDVERIWTRLQDKAHFLPVHVLLFTLPGIPSIYYGSEFGIDGRKLPGSDHDLRPALELSSFHDDPKAKLITALATLHRDTKVLSYGDYTELLLTNRQYAFSRSLAGFDVIVAVNNDPSPAHYRLPALRACSYTGALSGRTVNATDGHIHFDMEGDSGEIWIPMDMGQDLPIPVAPACRAHPAPSPAAPAQKPYEQMSVPELQQAILDKMAKNGPVTDRMRQDVSDNIWRDSLLNWVRSFV